MESWALLTDLGKTSATVGRGGPEVPLSGGSPGEVAELKNKAERYMRLSQSTPVFQLLA